MDILLNGEKVKKVRDREDGIKYIYGKRKLPGQVWQLRHDTEIIFTWEVMEPIYIDTPTD